MENESLLAIGQHFTDEDGNKQVPLYTKDPKTGMMKTKLVHIGIDQAMVNKNSSQVDDIAVAMEDLKANRNNPKAYEHYKNELMNVYGETAVSKFDQALKENDIIIK